MSLYLNHDGFQENLFFKDIFQVFPELSKIYAFKVFEVFQVCENLVELIGPDHWKNTSNSLEGDSTTKQN